MNTEGQMTLPGGRRLAYAEFGRPDGRPVMYFHGAPSSRLEPLLVGDEVLSRLGLRVVAPDRPGMGGPDFQKGRGFSDWPADVGHLADALGLGRFAVVGNSGGGAYAAVCAGRMPERLSAAVIVSGGWRMDWPEARENMSAVNRLVMRLTRWAPPLLRLLLKAMTVSAGGDREKELAQLRKRVPPADYEAFAQPGRVEALHRSMGERMRQGTKGAAWDMRLYVHEFGFRLDEIRMPLTLFHGEADVNSPIELARRVVGELPNARLVTYERDAHLSTLCNHFEEIGQALVNP